MDQVQTFLKIEKFRRKEFQHERPLYMIHANIFNIQMKLNDFKKRNKNSKMQISKKDYHASPREV